MNRIPKAHFQLWTKADRRDVCLVQQTFWGEWMLTQQWWGIHTGKGGSLSKTFESYEAAIAALARIEKRRRWRHYQRVE